MGKEDGERGEYGQTDITEALIPKITEEMDKVITRDVLSMMNACVHCGMCAESCRYLNRSQCRLAHHTPTSNRPREAVL